MPQTISLMILNIAPPNDPAPIPMVLCEKHGAWQEFPGRPDLDLNELRLDLGQRLNVLMASVEADPTADVLGPLGPVGDMLYQQLLPEGVRTCLENVAQNAPPGDPPVLRLHFGAKFDWIPWELLRDANDYLGVRFQIARMPISPSVPALDENNPRLVQRVEHLLGKDVFPANDPLVNDWRCTFQPPQTVQENMRPNGGAAPAWPTLADVRGAMNADILCLTCHGMYDDDRKKYYWAVDPNHVLGFLAGVFSDFFANLNLAGGRPLVFANACAFTGKIGGLVPGFGRELFARGAQNAVGAFGRIYRPTAIRFARRFFERLLSADIPIGRALLETKREFHQGATEPSHLFYCLYGPPGTRFQYPH